MDLRRKIFFYLAGMIVSLLVLRMFYLAGPPGNNLRNEAESISIHEGSIAAIRGRIFDHTGKLLAWSERCYDLMLDAKKLPLSNQKKLLRDLNSFIGEKNLDHTHLRYDRVIKYNLTTAELLNADKLCQKHPALSVELRWERHWSEPDLDLGEVRQIDGAEVGISGIEKEFEDDLHGSSGKFIVMLDRHGRWIDQTFQIIRNSCNGNDIILTEDTGEDTDDRKE